MTPIEQDDREMWTWPISPNDRDMVLVDDPPIPFTDLHFDNCYHEAVDNLQPLCG